MRHESTIKEVAHRALATERDILTLQLEVLLDIREMVHDTREVLCQIRDDAKPVNIKISEEGIK